MGTVYRVAMLSTLLCCIIVTCSVGARVQILNIGENVILEQGVEQNFTCLVGGGELENGILWSVGERRLESRNLVVEKDGVFQQSLSYLPTTEDNEEFIRCKSGVQEETKARLIIYQLDILSTSWVDTTKDKVVMMAGLYPPPTTQDILWNITTTTGDQILLNPGDEESDFSADIIEKDVDENSYIFTLNILNPDENLPRNVSIIIKSLNKTKTEIFLLQRAEARTELPVWIWVLVTGVFIVILISLVITAITCFKVINHCQTSSVYQLVDTQYL